MSKVWRKASGSVIAIAACALATPAQADIVIGPRFSYYFDNGNLRTSGIPGGVQDEGGLIADETLRALDEVFPNRFEFNSQQEGQGIIADQVAIPMIGAMVNFGNDRDRFTITAMYGDGSGSLSQTQLITRTLRIDDETTTDFGGATLDADFAYDRYDVELTWQRRTSETFAITGGLRYERLERSGPGMATIGVSSNVENFVERRLAEMFMVEPMFLENPPPASTPIVARASQETYSARLGATAFVPFGRNGVAFFNGLAHASHQPGFTSNTDFLGQQGEFLFSVPEENESETSLGTDFAVGAQFTLTSNMALDVRYRAILFFPLSGEQSFSDARVNHGVNLGVSFRL